MGSDGGINAGMGKDYRIGRGWRNGIRMTDWADDGRGRGRQNGGRMTELMTEWEKDYGMG